MEINFSRDTASYSRTSEITACVVTVDFRLLLLLHCYQLIAPPFTTRTDFFLPYQSIVAHTCIWFNIHVHAHVLFKVQWYCDYSVRDAKIGLIGNLSFVKF